MATEPPAPNPNRDRRNFWIFALHHIIVRTGWIFKTETVIMPGFLDLLGAGGAVRGCLPILGRIGQSVPQFLFANRLRRMPRQKWAMASCSVWQGLPWLTLALLLYATPDLPASWQIAAFLAIYGVFNVTYGNWMLLTGTLQGKLIPVERRGRLLAVSSFWGSSLAALAAAIWLGGWLRLGLVGYAITFAVVGAAFLVAGALVIAFDEPATEPAGTSRGVSEFAREAYSLIARDRNFRRLITVVTLFYMVLILFPHYTTYGKERLGLGASSFVLWVVVQNIMNAFGSALVGPLADRRGNRLALSVLTVAGAATPLVAMTLAHLPRSFEWLNGRVGAADLYWLVFLLLGFTPITQRVFVNYTLEISPPSQHALYLGTLQLAQGVPLLFSPAFGWLIDVTSFELMFVLGSVTILFGGLLAQTLVEPRACAS